MAVYFIQAGGPNGPVKIGKADDPIQRLRDLQVGNHEPLRLIHVVRGGVEREADIHGMFKPLSGRKEWFRFSSKMLKVPEFETAPLQHRSSSQIFVQRGSSLDWRLCPGCGVSHNESGVYCSVECAELDAPSAEATIH
jgi:hypothetical protein